MIYGLMNHIREDTTVLTQWLRGENLKLEEDEEPVQRVQVAAFRMIATVAMAIGSIWALQIVTFVVMFPIKIIIKLSFAVAFYAAAHDVFIMCRNANQSGFTPQKTKPRMLGLLSGRDLTQEKLATKFTHGTLMQPVWMWLYVHRNQGNKSKPTLPM